VRLAALNLEEISVGGSGWSRTRIGDSENLVFHLNSRVSHFLPECYLLCKFRRIRDLSAHVNS